MAQFSIAIDDAGVATVIAALCHLGNYQLYLVTTGDDPPLSPAQYANFVVRQYIQEQTAQYVAEQASQAALESIVPIPIDDATGGV